MGVHKVYGIDNNKSTLLKAKKNNMIDEGYESGEIPLAKSDVVIISLYPELLETFILENNDFFKKDSFITDVTGIKEKILLEVVPKLRKDVDFILYTNSLFLQDFSTKKFIKTDIIFSPLNMELFQEHVDDFNSEFVLSNTRVFNTFKPIPFNIENNVLSIKNKSQYNYMINEYQAKELNISLLQEFPINNISDVYMYNYQSYLREDLHAF